MLERKLFRRRAENAQPEAVGPTWLLAIHGFLLLVILVPLFACSAKPDPNTLVMIIESSPTNLDPRIGLDAYSERIDELLFDDLCTRDEHLNIQPGLADRWDIPDPLTYVFHLHQGVTFHDGRPLTSRDVASGSSKRSVCPARSILWATRSSNGNTRCTPACISRTGLPWR